MMKTPEQAKQNLRSQGITVAEFAKTHDFPAHAVYKVLNGQYKAHYGQAHDIAVALGLKKGSDRQVA